LVPLFIFNFNLVIIFVKMKQYRLSLNWDLFYFLYKSYDDILNKIEIFIKYFERNYEVIVLLLNKIKPKPNFNN